MERIIDLTMTHLFLVAEVRPRQVHIPNQENSTCGSPRIRSNHSLYG